MPYIEQDKLQEIIEDVNILEVVDYLGIECHKRGSNYFMLCPSPKHNDTHATNCYCKDGGKRVSCKACGYFASPIELVKDVTGMGFFDAVRVVWQLAGCPSYLYQKETSKRMFYLTYDEAKLIDIHLPNQIYLPVGEDAYKVPAKIQKDKTYDPNKLDYIYCKRERISWKTFFSEREFAMLVYDKALEKKQRFTDILKEIQPYMKQPYTKNCPDILILKKDIEKNIERTNKILQRAERVYHY